MVGRRLARRLALAMAFLPLTLSAQSTPPPSFEVASIRVNRDVSDRPTLMRAILQPGGRVSMRNQSLRDVILAAYGVNDRELIGGPGWVGSTGFDLDARGAADMTADTARAMLRTLLADRFSLAVHREQRDLPIYVLTMATGNGQPGPQLRPAAAQCAAPTRPKDMPPGPAPSKVPPQPAPLGAAGTPPRCPSLFRPGHFSGRAVSMDRLAGELADLGDRPVMNRTGMKGEFDLDLTYAPELTAAPEAAALPGLATALQDQLGLKLEAGRGPVQVLVIDRALMPTEN
jgi:uncharacterized protein (TIGR03435 family)